MAHKHKTKHHSDKVAKTASSNGNGAAPQRTGTAVAPAPPGKMKNKEYERALRTLARRARGHAGVGEGLGCEGVRGVRRARHRRQRRHDQGDHRAGQPAGVPHRRAAGADASARSRRCTCSATSRISRRAGEVVIFDRSWYNRAGVERVMGFTPDDQVQHFLSWFLRSSGPWSTRGSCCSSTGSR